MSEFGVVPRVIWPQGPSTEVDATLVPGLPPLPWLGGWIPSPVPDGDPIGTTIRRAFEPIQPLAQLLAISGYRVGDAYLVRNGMSLHFDGDDRSVDNEQPMLPGPREQTAEYAFRIEPLDYVPTDSARPTLAIGLMLPDGSEIDSVRGSETWLTVDVSAATTLDEAATLLDPWAVDAASAVATALAAAYTAGSKVDGLLDLFEQPIAFAPDVLAPEQSQVVQEAVYDVVNTYAQRPNIVALANRMTPAQIAVLLTDEQSDVVVPMSKRLIEYFESGGGARHRDKVDREQRLRSTADATGFDHTTASFFTVVLRLHDAGFADVLGGFARKGASDWPWVVSKVASGDALTADDVELIAEALASEETQPETVDVLERLATDYVTTFSTDLSVQSEIRNAYVNAIGQAPIEASDHGDAQLFAFLLLKLLEPGDGSVDLPTVTAAIEDTWARWQIARSGAWERNLRATALFVFLTAPYDICRQLTVETAAHFEPLLANSRINTHMHWVDNYSFARPLAANDGWTHAMARAFVAMWALHRGDDTVAELPTASIVTSIIGPAPLDEFDEALYRTAYQQRLAGSTVPRLLEAMAAFEALDQYTTAIASADLSFCRRFNADSLNDRLVVMLNDETVVAEFAAARTAGIRAARHDATLQPVALVDEQITWCSDENVAALWTGMTAFERSENVGRWRRLSQLVDPLSTSKLESGIAVLDMVAGTGGILESLSDADLDLLFDDPDWMPVSYGVGVAKQFVKLAKSSADMAKVVHLAQVTSFAMDNYEIGVSAVRGPFLQWTNALPFEMAVRNFERQPVLSQRTLTDIVEFRDSIRRDVASGYSTTGLVRLEKLGKFASVSVGVLAAGQFIARVEDVVWTGVEYDDLAGGLTELRDIATGSLVIAQFFEVGIKKWAVGVSPQMGAGATRFFDPLVGAPFWFSFASYGISAGKYLWDAWKAYERGEYVSMAVLGAASVSSIVSMGLVWAAMTGPAAALAFGTVVVVTAHMLIRDWWRESVAEQRFVDLMTDDTVLLLPTVQIGLPVGAAIPEVLVDAADTLLGPDVGVVVIATSNLSSISPSPGTWSTANGKSGIAVIDGLATDRTAESGTSRVRWQLTCPFPARLHVNLLAGTSRPPDEVRAPHSPVFSAVPEWEVWYESGDAAPFSVVYVSVGDELAPGDLVAADPSGIDVVATRACVVYLIDDAGGQSGITHRIQTRTRS